MADSVRERGQSDDAQRDRLRRSWWYLVAAFGALAMATAVRLLVPGAQPLDYALGGLIVIAALAGLLHRRAISELENSRRLASESFQRILQGLSRSVSPDAIVEAIVEDLGVAAGADHTVVVRLRADSRILEATLVSSRAGVPSSTTVLPLTDLEDPGPHAASVRSVRPPLGLAVDRIPVAVPVGSAGDERERELATTANGSARAREALIHAAPIGDPRPRIRDRMVPGPRGQAATPLEEWEPEPEQRPRRPGVGSLRIAVGGRGGEADQDAGSTAAAQRISEQLARRVRAVYGLKNTLATALVTDQGVVGAIVLSRRQAEPWAEQTLRLVRASAEEASAALARAYSFREAEARASTDALTGIPNRRYFDEFCGLLARRRRAEDAVGV